MSKSKKKKKAGKKADKSLLAAPVKSAKSAAGSGAKTLKTLTDNPVIADLVATALVATAAALKDSKKARQLAEQAGDEIEGLAKEGSERGSALWALALEVGRRALNELTSDEAAPKRSQRK